MKVLTFSLVLVLAFLSQGATTQAAVDLGKKIELFSDRDGLQFSSLQSTDEDKLWLVSLSIWGPDLAAHGQVRTVAYNLLNERTGEYLGDWITLTDRGGLTVTWPGTYPLTWAIDKPESVLKVLPEMRHLKLVFSVDQPLEVPVPTHHIDIGAYCTTHPSHFTRLDSDKKGCD